MFVSAENVVPQTAIAAMEKLISDGWNLGASRLEGQLRQFCEDKECGFLLAVGTAEFRAQVQALTRWAGAARYQSERRAQLCDGQFQFWVYRVGNGPSCHAEWDGFVASSDHPIWATHFPANGWICTCRLHGANSERGILRVKGDPAKALPAGWDTKDPQTGLPPGIEPGFGGTLFPDFDARLQALREGMHLRLA